MKSAIRCIIVLSLTLTVNAVFCKPMPEEARQNFTEIGLKYGHQVEEHEVVTEDGYILMLFHIPGRRKTPVLLMHGLIDCADSFILRGNTSLVISLANAGYDVWVGNNRGNKYSRRHVRLNPDQDSNFWDFSFNEAGYYDLPAMIDYILQTTGEKKMQTIGYSQGTTMHFVLLSTRLEYNDKIKVFVALGPVAFVRHLTPPLSIIAQYGPGLGDILKSLLVEEILNEKSPIVSFLERICSQYSFSYKLCLEAIVFHVTGFDKKRFEPSFLKVLLGHYPSATSRKNLIHWVQIALSNRFCDFDYGPKENMKRYSYIVPPDYNLRKVSAKVALLIGRNDKLSTIKDAEVLRALLPNVVYYHVMKPKAWNHIDFVWGNDMKMNVTLFPFIFQLLDKYN